MLCVILGHVMTIVIKTNVDLSGKIIEHFIVAFNMPLFVIISGYSNLNTFNKITKWRELIDFVKKSVIRILLPVVTFCVIGLTPNFIFFTILVSEYDSISYDRVCCNTFCCLFY